MFGKDISIPLEELLGSGRKTRGSNFIYNCPVCKHRKRKLEIDHVSYKWHCWVCGRGGRSVSTLLSWLSVTPVGYRKFADFLVGGSLNVSGDNLQQLPAELPYEFISLATAGVKDTHWELAATYLVHQRKLRVEDIIRFNIGYCTNGGYAGRVVIPSYASDFSVNYVDARAYTDTPDKFMNAANVSKNIVGFESYLDWSDDVILVESSINAITLRSNAAPLYGKVMSGAMLSKLRNNRPNSVTVWLDPDAVQDAVKIVSALVSNGIRTKWVNIGGTMDVNDYGYDAAMEILDSAQPVTHATLMKYKTIKQI